MDNYKASLLVQQKNIRKLLNESEKKLAKSRGLTRYKLHVSTSKGTSQYYVIDENNKKRYLSKKDIKVIRNSVQYDYDFHINKLLKDMDGVLNRFIKNYDYHSIQKLYDKLPQGRKELVIPIIESDHDYIERWREEHPANQNTFPIQGQFKTNKGELVRSKSEKIIADVLDRFNVPYQYEPLLELNGLQTVCPDFIVLNVRTRKSLYWEHLGLISDMDYADKNFRKILQYENNGFILGRDLIVTSESVEMPLKTQIIEEKIKEWLL